MTELIEVGTYVCVSLVENDGAYYVPADQWDALDAAYHHWVERRIDKVLELTCVNGATVLLAASRIGDLCRSTPDSRLRQHDFNAALKAEEGFTE